MKRIQKIRTLQLSVLQLADKHQKTIMPGLTHLQVAQPVTFGDHLMAYYEMLERDLTRFEDARKRMNQLPLGAAALAGTSYPIDRNKVAEKLKFDGVCENSLDAVSDRDFAIEFTFAASLLMPIYQDFQKSSLCGQVQYLDL
jgi:argininosuccinate lyase